MSASHQKEQQPISPAADLSASSEMRDRLSDVFRLAPAAMCIMRGPDHAFEMVNDRFVDLVGQRDLLGQSVRDALPELGDQGLFDILDQVYRSGEPFSGTNVAIHLRRGRDGKLEERILDFVYVPLGAPGAVTGVLCHGIDVTERKRTEDQLRASEERYRTLFESIDEGFCLIEMIFDADGEPVDYRFVETNPAFAAQSGMQNMAGRRMRELAPNHEAFWFDTYARVARTGQPVRFVSEATQLGRWFDVYASRVGDENSNRVAIIFNDITDKKRVQDDLQKLNSYLAARDKRKTEFLATLAHELRNPLAPIANGLAVLRVSRNNPNAVERVLGVMERQIGQLTHLVDDLLDIARITNDKIDIRRERVLLRDVIDAAVETSMPAIEAGQHTLTLTVPHEPIEIEVDQRRIAQVISNLLNNAAKYTPMQGHITIDAHCEGGLVVISVRDNGVGIAPESIPRLFNLFSQIGPPSDIAPGGMGIGLSLVRRLAEMHGGDVSASSPGLGKGSTFVLRLPLPTSASAVDGGVAGESGRADAANAVNAAAPVPPVATASATTPAVKPASAPDPMRVLVVDDNVDAAETLAYLLRLENYQVAIAHDGADALRQVTTVRPQAVLLDLGMPGMTGYEVARAIRKLPDAATIQLIALTGWGTDKDRERTREAGFNHHLTKPVSIAVIGEILRKVAAAV